MILGGDDLTDHGFALPTPGAGSGNAVSESEPNDTAATANAIAIRDDFSGAISPSGDSDFVKFTASAGTFIVATTVLGTLSDSTLRLLDTDGTTELLFNDDASGLGLASQTAFRFSAAGTYFLQVEGLSGSSGTYTLQLRQLASVSNQKGWLYIQKALQNIAPAVTRPGNDGTVAALGSAPSFDLSGGDAGAAIGFAAMQAGLSVTYYEGATAISQFFTDLANGAVNPAILWIAGTGASNDLDSGERTELTNNATRIRDFVASGGGLLAHGSGPTAYGWLQTLIPTITEVSSGGSDDLVLTPTGMSFLPGLTNADINAGPWHSQFEGNLGGLQVLAQSTVVTDSQGNPAAVIIGGRQAQLSPTRATPAPLMGTPASTGLVLLLFGVGLH